MPAIVSLSRFHQANKRYSDFYSAYTPVIKTPRSSEPILITGIYYVVYGYTKKDCEKARSGG